MNMKPPTIVSQLQHLCRDDGVCETFLSAVLFTNVTTDLFSCCLFTNVTTDLFFLSHIAT